MNSTWSINQERSFDFIDLIGQFWSKKIKVATQSCDYVIEIETNGIHPKYIEIIDDGSNLLIKGLNINKLNERLFNVIDKSQFKYIDVSNISYRSGKIVINAVK